jgi:serine/threonine protein kinase
MAATLSLALGLCKEIQEKYSLILVESKNSPLIHKNQCMILDRKLSDTRETLVAVQHKLSHSEFTSSQSSVVGTPVIHGLIHVLKRVHAIFFKDCFCKDKWLEAALRQGGDLKETFVEIVSDLQWYRSVLHSIVFKQVRQDSKDLAPVDCNRNLSKIDLEALSTAAKWDQEDLRGFLREFNGDPARHGENGNYISMQCLATQLLNKLEFQPWSSTAKEKHDESLHEDSRNKWSEGPLVLLVNMQDLHKGALLGEGSFGSVHETNWLGETYAMKSHKPGLKECLKAEIKALAGLQHPHVIRLVGCAEEEGRCLYLMERMDKSLSKMLEDCSLSLVQRVDMMLQIAEGVRYLHSNNLAHRDLKPENILVKHDDSGPETLMLAPLVEDFWIAKVSDFGTVKEKMENYMAYEGQTMNIGTTMFMAPEMYQLEDSAKRPERFHPMKTDVYSFALICFVVLTSESTPFPFEELRNPSVRDFKDRVRKGKRPKLPADCPVYLSDLIQQCWDGNQVRRPNFDYICTELRQIKDFLLTGMVISP